VFPWFPVPSPKLTQISDQKRQLQTEIAQLGASLADLPSSPVILVDLREGLRSFSELCAELPPHKQKERLGCLLKSVVLTTNQLDLQLWRMEDRKSPTRNSLACVIDRMPIAIRRRAHGRYEIQSNASGAEAGHPS